MGDGGPACSVCGKPAERVAVSLAAKIVGPDCRGAWCLDCLAKKFSTTRDSLLATARLYQARGCTLFAGLKLD